MKWMKQNSSGFRKKRVPPREVNSNFRKFLPQKLACNIVSTFYRVVQYWSNICCPKNRLRKSFRSCNMIFSQVWCLSSKRYNWQSSCYLIWWFVILMQWILLQICYGLTETSPVTAQTLMDDPVDLRVSTVGRVHPNCEVRRTKVLLF